MFEVCEAARFVGVSSAALTDWIRPGIDGEASVPLLQLADPLHTRLSFANLVEAHILEATRKHDLSSADVRTAIDAIRKCDPGTPHPLLTRGFHNWGSAPLRRLAIDLDRYLERIDRDDNGDPYQFFPMRYNTSRYVVLNIGLSAGHPVIAGTGLRVGHLSGLIGAGMSVSSVASRYGLTEDAVMGAVAFLAA